MRLIDLLDRVSRDSPGRPCIVDANSGRDMTYGDVVAATWGVARELRELGVGRGQAVALLADNAPEPLVALLGALRAGCAYLFLTSYDSADRHQELLRRAGALVLLHDDAHQVRADELRSRDAALRTLPLDRVTASRAAAEKAVAGLVPGVAKIGFTGGTTGTPKGVLMTDRTLLAMVAAYLVDAGVPERPRYLAATPLAHAAGTLVYVALAAGGTTFVLPRADPEAVLDAIETHAIDTVFLPPTVIYRLLAHPTIGQRDLSSLRCLTYAAAPIAEAKLREALGTFGPVLVQTYGQAEAPMICTVLTAADHLRALEQPESVSLLRSCGRPAFMTDVTVLNGGRPCAVGEVGDVAVRGDLVVENYLDMPLPERPHGWHRTGDVGYQDGQGYLFLVDRRDDVIVSGGINVYSTEVEQALLAHPDVQDCAVVGIPHADWGEAVHAAVELKPSRAAGQQELLAHVREALGPVRAPKTLEIVDELPRSRVGKVLKRRIREPYWTDRDRAVN